MSYKLNLSDLERESGSLTAQLAERIAADIESGVLAPGEKLPTTRELAAARVDQPPHRRARLPAAGRAGLRRRPRRPRHVRALAPAGRGRQRRRGLAARRPPAAPVAPTPSRCSPSRSASGRDAIPLAAGFPADELLPTARDGRARGARSCATRARAWSTCRSRASPRCASGSPSWAPTRAGRSDPEEIVVTTGARQAHRPRRAHAARPRRRRRHRVADVRRHAHLAAGDRRAASSPIPVDGEGLDVAALERHARPPRDQARRAAARRATTRPAPTCPRRGARAWPPSRASAGSSSSRTASTRRWRSTAASARACARLAPAHVIYVDSLSKSIGGGLRVGWIAASGPVHGRLVAPEDGHRPALAPR